METSTKFKARCLVKDLGRENGIRYAKNIGNPAYIEVAEYIKQHTNDKILSYQGNS